MIQEILYKEAEMLIRIHRPPICYKVMHPQKKIQS